MTDPDATSAALDVYLQPAVVGGGLGDIEEVLAVGRRLGRAGWPLLLYRRPGRSMPPSVAGPWHWPPVRRVRRLAPRASHALTVTPWWGVSASPDFEPAARPGPWSIETGDVERAYGRSRVVHLSLEEFARTLASRAQTLERWREGGISRRRMAIQLRRRSTVGEIRAFHDAYRRWRAFDRPNVLHLFTGFRRSPGFAREFPEAIQVGPLWPERGAPIRRGTGPPRWTWYASPSTSDRLAAEIAAGLPRPAPGSAPIEIEVRGPRRFELPLGPGVRWRWRGPMAFAEWQRRFHRADLRLVTGSRTLLEAIVDGGPFLYFNGVLNRGARTRRHRPEKIVELLAVWRGHGVSKALRNDLADFSRLRNVAAIAARARQDPAWAGRFPARSASVSFGPGREDAGRLIEDWARAWAESRAPAEEFVGELRTRAHDPRSRL
jgi:hypothetical protein